MKKIIDDLAIEILNLGYDYDLTIYPKLLNSTVIRGFKLKIKNKFGLTVLSKTMSWPNDKHSSYGSYSNCEEYVTFMLADTLTQFLIKKVPDYNKEYKIIKNKINDIEKLNKQYNIEYNLTPILNNSLHKGFEFYIYHTPKKYETIEKLKVTLDCLLTQCQLSLYSEGLVDLRKKCKDDEQEIFNNL